MIVCQTGLNHHQLISMSLETTVKMKKKKKTRKLRLKEVNDLLNIKEQRVGKFNWTLLMTEIPALVKQIHYI